jgi:uncharacterized cupredoxin-like copper-binding protein
MRSQRSVLALLIAGLLALALIACDRTGGPPPTGSFSSAVASQRIDITETDTLKFIPGNLVARAGDVTFVVHNTGTIAHDFVLAGNGVTFQSGIIKGGETATLTAPALKPGTYVVYSSLPGQKEANMSARLEVR